MDKNIIIEYIENVEREFENVKNLVNWEFNGLSVDDLKEIVDSFKNTIDEFEYLKDKLFEQLDLNED